MLNIRSRDFLSHTRYYSMDDIDTVATVAFCEAGLFKKTIILTLIFKKLYTRQYIIIM